MDDLPVISFKSARQWDQWLSSNHEDTKGIWLQFYKKDAGVQSVTHAEALDAALCYGWIDGQLKKKDDKSWLQKFTRRRPRSIWSRKNREHAERLEKAGRMKPAGQKEVEQAKADGRWDKAYDSPKNMEIPEDFLRRLSKNRKAAAFFDTLNKANQYAVAWRLQTAKKPETREKRMKVILDMLARGEKFHE